MGDRSVAAALGRHPTLEGALTWLAVELGAAADHAGHGPIRALAGALPECDEPAGQLRALADHVGRHLRVRRPSLGHSPGYDDLRPDLALSRLEGDELLISAILAAVGQRRGYEITVVWAARRAAVAHAWSEADAPVLSPRHHSRLMRADEVGPDRLVAVEPVAVAGLLLDRIDERAALLGDLTMRIRAHELHLALPTDRREQGRRQVALQRARSSMN